VGKDGYWTWYPGDDYVDVIGFDDYSTLEPGDRGNDVAGLAADLAWLVRQARERGKIPALTEAGFEAIPDPKWWTNRLLAAFTARPGAVGIAWVLVWRNANAKLDRAGHFYAPYPGHPSALDFARFRQHPLILFADELPDLYRVRRDEVRNR
jgi:mannan endo-1,4-beta-mannosidase